MMYSIKELFIELLFNLFCKDSSIFFKFAILLSLLFISFDNFNKFSLTFINPFFSDS